MARTLSERLRAHEQQKARLAEAEAKLRLDERKQRTRRLVEAGALVEKSMLLELDSNALYGALLSLRDGADDTKQVEQWAALGGRAAPRRCSVSPSRCTAPSSSAAPSPLPGRGPGRRDGPRGLARMAALVAVSGLPPGQHRPRCAGL